MTATSLRFATACGMSDRLRLDLVLNDFVACALASGEITVLSDGTPWRPLIDVRDMARAIEWAICAATATRRSLPGVNVGSDAWNYQVKDLANAVAASVPGTSVSINAAAPPDKRSYKVDFSLFRELAPRPSAAGDARDLVAALRDGLRAIDFSDRDFRQSQLIRLKVLERQIERNRLATILALAARPAKAG